MKSFPDEQFAIRLVTHCSKYTEGLVQKLFPIFKIYDSMSLKSSFGEKKIDDKISQDLWTLSESSLLVYESMSSSDRHVVTIQERDHQASGSLPFSSMPETNTMSQEECGQQV